MSETKKYIGITIGPIFDMMNLVSTPAALWATSYMFSMVSKETCTALKEKGYKIISPFFDSADNELFNKNDGIGLFHDRIIIEAEEKDLDVINKIKKDVLTKVGKAFEVGDELKKRVLFIAAVIKTENGENPILKGGKILDSLELSRKVMFAEKGNPILETFTGVASEEEEKEENCKDANKKEGKNQKIKRIAKENLDIDVSRWPMVFTKTSKDSGEELQLIKSLPAIAGSVRKSDLKKYNYFAIVRSDGDNMSKIIERLPINTSDGQKNGLTLTDFSKICLEYCSEVAKLVKEFKGVPVYSSGDDLLAIMPCDSGEKGTVLNFVKEVNNKFGEMFKPYINIINAANDNLSDNDKIAVPSLSFGISICFKKFPIYEALADSADLLFNIAKSKKNCTAIRLQKHSGQSEGLLIFNDALDSYLELQQIVLGKDDSISDVLLSALYKTEKFSKLFLEAKDESQIKNLFVNTFDAPAHDSNNFLHKNLPEFYGEIRKNNRILALSSDGLEEELNDITVFNFVMRVLKFFVEKAGKEGKDNE